MSKGHAPKPDERDIGYAWKMKKRIDIFDLGLEDVDAHILRIIEIIEEEKNMIEMKKMREIEAKLNG